MTTDNTQAEIGKILRRLVNRVERYAFEKWDSQPKDYPPGFRDVLFTQDMEDEATEAILDWHNKQIEQATDSVEAMVADIEFKAGINHVTMGGEWVHKDEVNKQIEAVLDRLWQHSEVMNSDVAPAYGVPLSAVEAERNKLKERQSCE